MSLTLLTGQLRPGSGRAGVLSVWRWRLAGHRLTSELLAGLGRAGTAVSLRVGLVARPALLARVRWTLLALSTRPRCVLAGSVLLTRTGLTWTLLAHALLTWTGLTWALPCRRVLTRTLLRAVLTWALLSWTVCARTVLTGALLCRALLRRTLLTRPVLIRTLLSWSLVTWTLVTLLRRAVLARLRLSLLGVVPVLAGRRAVGRGLTLLADGAAVLSGRGATVLLTLLRRLGPVGLVRILRCSRSALLGAARAGLGRERSGWSLLAVRLLWGLARMPTLRGALLTGRRVLLLLAVGWLLFGLVLLGRWTLTWHS